MPKQAKIYNQADYTTTSFEIIGQLPASCLDLDFVQDGDKHTLVIDGYGIGQENLDSWALSLKASATAGAIYAYDHRVDGTVDVDLPAVSLMLEGLSNISDVVEIVNQMSTVPILVKYAIEDYKLAQIRELDEAALTNSVSSGQLLAFASAF